MSLLLSAPGSDLRVEADFRDSPRAFAPLHSEALERKGLTVFLSSRLFSQGTAAFSFRILFGKNAVTGWCALPLGFDVDENVSVRSKSIHGALVVREGTFSIHDLSGHAYKLRIALSDGCVVILPSSRKVVPHITMSSGFSCGYAAADNGCVYSLTKTAVENKACSSALLFYSHGRCSVFIRRYSNGAVEFCIAHRPADLVVPRRLAAEVMLPKQAVSIADFTGSQASRNVRELFLGCAGNCDPAPDMAEPCSTVHPLIPGDITFGTSRIAHSIAVHHPASFLELKLEPGIATPVHARAMSILTASDYDASTGFRGEFGEYFCMARRSGESWTVAAATVKMRVLTLFFPYLDDGAGYDAEWILDEGSILPDNIEHITPAVIRAGDKAVVKMPAFGGFVLKLTKRW